MGLFNFNRTKKQAATGEAGSAWNKLRNSGNTPTEQVMADQERQAQLDKQRQERKAIGMILRGESAITSSGNDISEADRTAALQTISSGAFDRNAESAILRRIAVPSASHGGTPEQVFREMDSLHARRIFTFMNDIPDSQENLNQVSSSYVDTTLQRFPTPIEFAERSEEMLERIRQHNPPEKYQEYVRDMDKFKRQLYGKRQEYFEAFQSLEKQAAKYAAAQTKRAQVLNALHSDAQDQTIPFQAAQSQRNFQNTQAAPRASDSYQSAPGAQAGQILYPEEDQGYLSPEMQEFWRAPAEQPQSHDDIPPPRGPSEPRRPQPEARFARAERIPAKPVEVYRVSKAEAKKFLKQGRIDGDPYLQDGSAYQLTPDYLAKHGLGPEYKFKLDDKVEIATSKVYHAQEHDAVNAYVRTDKGTKIVTYYRSNSQGTWRYLPDYVSTGRNGGEIEWFGKGVDEESLNLPAATQEALEVIFAQPHLQDANTHTTFALAGTAKRYSSRDEYLRAIDNYTLRGDHYREVALSPDFSLGKASRHKRAPEYLDLTDGSAPDFSQPGSSYNFQSSLYGPVTSEHYTSGSGLLSWTFNRDQSGRAWIGGIEVNSPISSAGLRTKWAQAGDYGTPLYDYSQQDGGYGDPSDRRGQYYVNMWTNYLSRMPIIKKYLAHKQRRAQR